jgi:hypothetical protein
MWSGHVSLLYIGSHVERMVNPKEYHKIEMHGSQPWFFRWWWTHIIFIIKKKNKQQWVLHEHSDRWSGGCFFHVTKLGYEESVQSFNKLIWSSRAFFACSTPNLTSSYFGVGRHAEQRVDNNLNKRDKVSCGLVGHSKMPNLFLFLLGWHCFTEDLRNDDKCQKTFILQMMKIMLVVVRSFSFLTPMQFVCLQSHITKWVNCIYRFWNRIAIFDLVLAPMAYCTRFHLKLFTPRHLFGLNKKMSVFGFTWQSFVSRFISLS